MTEPAKKSNYSEPEYAKPGKKTDYPYYLSSIDKHNLPDMQKLLEEYSHIPRDKQSEHVHKIRDDAWAIRTYPCVGLGVFLCPYISLSSAYPQILSRLKSGVTMMDVGCFLGTDLRRLVFDGAPSTNMYAVDIVSQWDIGCDLFRDRDRFGAKFIETDILAKENTELNSLKGRVDVISVSAVLHQWLWDKQAEAARQLVSFSSGPGAVVVGHQIGNEKAGELQMKGMGVPVYRQSPESFERLWDQVGEETGTRWETKAKLIWWNELGWDPEDYKWMNEGDQVLDFVVTRVE